MRAHCSAGISLAAILVSLPLPLFLSACSGQTTPTGASASPAAAAPAVDRDRFEVALIPMRRGAGHLLRTDTATGQAWIMGTMQEPKWQALREGSEGVPSPQEIAPGRYEIQFIPQTRGSPTLVRVDGVTGRIWRKGSTSPGPWVGVPIPDPSITEPDADWEPTTEPLVNNLPLAPPPGAGAKPNSPAAKRKAAEKAPAAAPPATP